MPERPAAPQPQEDAGRAPLPPQVTTPLLTLITQQSMDEDYLHVAERRGRGQLPSAGSRSRPHRTAAVVVAVFGVLVTTAAVQTAQDADENRAGRATLVERVNDRRATVSDLQDRIVELREQNELATQNVARLTETAVEAQSRLRRLQVTTGYLPVQGEGVRLTLENPVAGDNLIRDIDLQKAANGLWLAGAEAVAVNGQRLTAVSAIRNSGVVVNVNSVPIAAPYVVTAIGDSRSLLARFQETASGSALINVAQALGFAYRQETLTSVKLPAARRRTLLSAAPLTTDEPRAENEEGAR
ncbi:uncharacterized protein YlxW (UPF0749 family) [Nocardioides salarius]|uniref:Uncharacterized protein YlxW (UPF0749 family) n=1 Tax=Nocardioides salarius TaxID=374513 RepID=A0ABS2M592_9ACTN|nr:DUF881 domain-containing protein [Nocardioides salarius]MBM7506342.1 uncharacterized protein YlxW (UPF0749 family) [Nocardioides salarius]